MESNSDAFLKCSVLIIKQSLDFKGKSFNWFLNGVNIVVIFKNISKTQAYNFLETGLLYRALSKILLEA